MSKTSTSSKAGKKMRTGSNGNGSFKSNGSAKAAAKSSEKKSSAQGSTLDDLLEDLLKDVYSAETQLVEALPKMAEASDSEDLQDAFNHHLEQTKRQVERLEKVFTRLSISKDDVKTCEAMKGLIEEGKHIIDSFEEGPVRDSALIIAAQKVEHYEIASYGSICELCDVLGYHRMGEILGRSLDEEESTDENLTEIAMAINDEACEVSFEEGGGRSYNFSTN